MYRQLIPFLLLALTSCTQPEPQILHLDSIQRIENNLRPHLIIQFQEPQPSSILDRLVHHNVPGLSVALMLNGEFAWARGYGIADSAAGLPVTPETLFQAASISKPIAAMAAHDMIESGQLSLDQDINTYLTQWQLPGEGFTEVEHVSIRRILNHTAGTTVWGFPGYARTEDRISTRQVLTGEGNTDPIVVYKEPGESWRYSGGGYTVLQLAMEEVSGQDFETLMKDRVLSKLDMVHSTYAQPLIAAWHDRAAAGYRSNGELVEGNWHVYPEQAAAGLWTTPSDLLQYAASVQRARSGSTNEVLEPATVLEMLTPGMDNYGLGPAISSDGLRFQHGGANEGFRCYLTAAIDGSYAVAIMTNSDNGSAVVTEYLEALAEEYGWAGFDKDIRETVRLNSEQLRALTGTYEFEEWGVVSISLSDSTVIIEGGPLSRPTLFYAESPDVLFDSDDGTRLEFEFENGQAMSFSVLGRTATRMLE